MSEAHAVAVALVRYWPWAVKGALALLAGAGLYYAFDARQARLEAVQERQAAEIAAIRTSIKDEADRSEARWQQLNREREQHGLELRELRTRFEGLERTTSRMDANITVILDRLGRGRRGRVYTTIE